jgi:hypothetical protein
MVDVYLLETLMGEHKAAVERRATLVAALHELEQSRGRNRETLVSRLRRAAMALLPVRRAKTIAFRAAGWKSVKS